VIVTALAISLTIWGCNPPIRYVPSDDVIVIEEGEPAPYRGVLIGPVRWQKIYKRLLECEE